MTVSVSSLILRRKISCTSTSRRQQITLRGEIESVRRFKIASTVVRMFTGTFALPTIGATQQNQERLSRWS
jgi:hypothetical protein